MARICADAQLKDNLPADERKAYKSATKDKNNVFVPTDKTGKILRICKNTMAACIYERKWKAFDIIEDPITLGITLNQHKRKINDAIEGFILEKEILERKYANEAHASSSAGACNKPCRVHDTRFSKGTTALEKIITILTKEAHFLPSFGPLKPHIKDH